MAEKRSAEVYGRIVRDRSISHGAFRLWHLLNDFAGKKRMCWPGQRKLQKILGCQIASLKPWTQQLVQGSYIRTEEIDKSKHTFTGKKNEGFIYYMLAGTVSDTGNTGTVSGFTSEPLPEPETPPVSGTGNVTNPNGTNPKRTKNSFSSKFSQKGEGQ